MEGGGVEEVEGLTALHVERAGGRKSKRPNGRNKRQGLVG